MSRNNQNNLGFLTWFKCSCWFTQGKIYQLDKGGKVFFRSFCLFWNTSADLTREAVGMSKPSSLSQGVSPAHHWGSNPLPSWGSSHHSRMGHSMYQWAISPWVQVKRFWVISSWLNVLRLPSLYVECQYRSISECIQYPTTLAALTLIIFFSVILQFSDFSQIKFFWRKR